jgi:hypothetical protein
MIQNVVREMGGMAAFGIVSVCLFFVVFTAALVFACLQRKSLCDKMRALPLEDGSIESPSNSQHE